MSDRGGLYHYSVPLSSNFKRMRPAVRGLVGAGRSYYYYVRPCSRVIGASPSAYQGTSIPACSEVMGSVSTLSPGTWSSSFSKSGRIGNQGGWVAKRDSWMRGEGEDRVVRALQATGTRSCTSLHGQAYGGLRVTSMGRVLVRSTTWNRMPYYERVESYSPCTYEYE